MNNGVEYPYLPEGRDFLFVPEDHPHMQAAKRAQEDCSGDPVFPIGAVLVKDNKIVARAGNGFNLGNTGPHICPRRVLECPSGQGYELCDLHDPPGHAEPQLMNVARAAGIDAIGSDVYMYGHWWCCEPCWKSMIDAGVARVFLPEGAHELFARDRVYAQTLVPSVKRIQLELEPELKEACEKVIHQLELSIVDTDAQVLITDQGQQDHLGVPYVICIQPKTNEPCAFVQESERVFRLFVESRDDAARKIEQILRML